MTIADQTDVSEPLVENRGADDFTTDLLDRVAGYLPGVTLPPTGPAAAVLGVYGHYAATIAERLNRAPDKNELAFLDMLGLSLLPARAARAPVVFALRPGLGDSRAPAGSQVGASVAGVTGPLIFSTEHDIGLASAHLTQLGCTWPGADTWCDLGSTLTAATAATLFTDMQPMAHDLYLAHDTYLDLQGRCEVQVSLALSSTAQRRIDVAWEYFDGSQWTGFAPFVDSVRAGADDSIDGTAGWTRSGTVVLRTPFATSAPGSVNGLTSHWIRARLAESLTGDIATAPPTIAHITLATLVAPPIGSLRGAVDGTDETGPLLLFLADLDGLSPDVSSATATLVCTSDPDVASIQLTLASGHTILPAGHDGDFEVRVDVPGFTTYTLAITMTTGGNPRYLVLRPTIIGAQADLAFADTLPIDLTKPFYPFGSAAAAGTSFAIASDEAFGKPGAQVTIVFEPATTGREVAAVTATSTAPDSVTPMTPTMMLEYFDGDDWTALASNDLDGELFSGTSHPTVAFTVPDALEPTVINGQSKRWVRIKITSGFFGVSRTTVWEDSSGSTHRFTSNEAIPPALNRLRLAYYFRSDPAVPDAVFTDNDYTWVDAGAGTAAASTQVPFAPFTPTADPTPGLYLGFDAPLPVDLVSLYADIAEVAGVEAGPDLVWERFDPGPKTWDRVEVEDETVGLALPGMIEVTWPGATVLPSVNAVHAGGDTLTATDPDGAAGFRPGDPVVVTDGTDTRFGTLAAVTGTRLVLTAPLDKTFPRCTITKAGLARFGTPCPAWLRARLRSDGDPPQTSLNAMNLNATWASAFQTYHDEVLGSGDGNPGQSVLMKYPPVLPGQVVEVRELTGARAAFDVASLRDEIIAAGGSENDLRIETDTRSGAVTAVWVTWAERPNLFFSQPSDRHYTIERSTGTVSFGDDTHGRTPTVDTDDILARSYTGGGGAIGNLPADTITQCLSGIPAASVTNVRAAQGGADSESVDAVRSRGPASVAGRNQAMTAGDYEVLARAASPAVAVARAVPTIDSAGVRRPGFVRLVVMPASSEPQPFPSFELRREVAAYVRRRSPASIAGGVSVVGPTYQLVGVTAQIGVVDGTGAGLVVEAVTSAIESFLHPLSGGPDGAGWGFGRSVYASDLAAVIESVPGVDHTASLELRLNGTPVGDVATIPDARTVAAGRVAVTLTGGS